MSKELDNVFDDCNAADEEFDNMFGADDEFEETAYVIGLNEDGSEKNPEIDADDFEDLHSIEDDEESIDDIKDDFEGDDSKNQPTIDPATDKDGLIKTEKDAEKSPVACDTFGVQDAGDADIDNTDLTGEFDKAEDNLDEAYVALMNDINSDTKKLYIDGDGIGLPDKKDEYDDSVHESDESDAPDDVVDDDGNIIDALIETDEDDAGEDEVKELDPDSDEDLIDMILDGDDEDDEE